MPEKTNKIHPPVNEDDRKLENELIRERSQTDHLNKVLLSAFLRHLNTTAPNSVELNSTCTRDNK